MMRSVVRFVALAVLLSAMPVARAQAPVDARWQALYDRIIRLEYEMKRMKRDYEARIRRLEKALRAARREGARTPANAGGRKAAEVFRPLPPLRQTDIAPDVAPGAPAPNEEVLLGRMGEGAASGAADATPPAGATTGGAASLPPRTAGPIPLPGAVTDAVGAGSAASLAPGQVVSAPLTPPPGGGATAGAPSGQPAQSAPQTAPALQPVNIPPALAGLSASALLDKARQNFLARRHDEAEQAYRAFLARFPNHPQATAARFELGQTLYIKGQFREAGRLFVDVYRAAPDSKLAPRALLRLGQALKRMGRRKEACKAWQSLIERYPDSRAATLLAPREMKRLKCRRS